MQSHLAHRSVSWPEAAPRPSHWRCITAARAQRVRCRAATAAQDVGPRDLWVYPGTRVKTIELDSFRLMHRASFSHRNVRTYVVVVYVPGSIRCAEVEQEVERLASGLSHEPRVVVARLNALGSSEAFMFSTGALEVKQYPTIFLYPEGSPGYMRFTGSDVTAEGLLSAINACYRQVLGGRKQLALSAEAAPSPPHTVAIAAAPSTSTAVGAAPVVAGRQVVHSIPQQQQVLRDLTATTRGYWGAGKVAFWAFVVLFGIGALCWDRWGEDWWARRTLLDRQRRREAGEKFDDETDLEDLMDLALLEKKQPLSREQAVEQAGGPIALGARVDQDGPPAGTDGQQELGRAQQGQGGLGQLNGGAAAAGQLSGAMGVEQKQQAGTSNRSRLLQPPQPPQ